MGSKFTTEELRELLRRYRLGQCSTEELEAIERWYRSFEDRDVSEFVDDDLRGLHELKKRMFQGLSNRIDLAEQPTAGAKGRVRPLRKRPISFEILKRVAAILLVATVVGLYFYFRTATVGGEMAITPAVDTEQSDQVAVANVAGTIYLSDGSVVWLKGGSTLEYPEAFGGDTREVTLVGEAFFDVARDPEKPFIIHSDNFTTRVLGTSFNIKAYDDADAQEVLVVTGEVVVSVKEQSDNPVEVVLTPNQKAVYSKRKNSLVHYEAEEETDYATLTASKLAFDEVPLEDIVNVLNATYGARISLASEAMRGCLVTVDLTHESLEVGLEIVSKAVDAHVTIDGKDIVLSGSGCASGTD